MVSKEFSGSRYIALEKCIVKSMCHQNDNKGNLFLLAGLDNPDSVSAGKY